MVLGSYTEWSDKKPQIIYLYNVINNLYVYKNKHWHFIPRVLTDD